MAGNRKMAADATVHEKAQFEPGLPVGPFARLKDGTILSVSGRPAQLRSSEDEGATWTGRPLQPGAHTPEPAPTGALLASRTGAVILGFSNVKERNWDWSDDLRDAPDARLPTYATRSLDDGQTWQDTRKLHDEWTGAIRDILQTGDGRIVFASMKMRHNPGRHTVLTYLSDDDGITWQASNAVDLGGSGHHDGLTEGTLVELDDGRLLQYARTNWGRFWRLISVDGGESWHPCGPSQVEASSAPGILKRLASGRIALLWNRPHPDGADSYPLRGGDGTWSATPASNFREELSISFSEDECESWSPPIVVVRNPGSEASYPYVFEPQPGLLWITAHRWEIALSLREADFAP